MEFFRFVQSDLSVSFVSDVFLINRCKFSKTSKRENGGESTVKCPGDDVLRIFARHRLEAEIGDVVVLEHRVENAV